MFRVEENSGELAALVIDILEPDAGCSAPPIAAASLSMIFQNHPRHASRLPSRFPSDPQLGFLFLSGSLLAAFYMLNGMSNKISSINATLSSLGTFSALAATAHAATVQITLSGNKISSTSVGGNSLNADITGDLINDLTFTGQVVQNRAARVVVNGSMIFASYNNASSYAVDAQFAAAGVGIASASAIFPNVQNVTYLNPITFTDSRINGGAVTQAWVEVNAYNLFTVPRGISHTVALTRVIFDDASVTRPTFGVVPGTQTEWTAAPEPSGLALLALGAGGLLTRRRRQMA